MKTRAIKVVIAKLRNPKAGEIMYVACGLILLIPLLTGCQNTGMGRYSEFIFGELPEQYAELKTPQPATSRKLPVGENLFTENCAACHGISGKGDGELSTNFSPRPANLTFTRKLPIATDTFFFWTISEGGEAFDTAMPGFADTLSEEEIWKIIDYVKNDL
jgi:hypothetical protein